MGSRRPGIRARLQRDYACLTSEGGCGAKIGEPCMTKHNDGWPEPRPTQPHAARWNQFYDRRMPPGPRPSRTVTDDDFPGLHIELTNAQSTPVKFLMAGMERPPGMGVRLYASRNWRQGLQFGQATANYKTFWHVQGDCDNMLVIDGEDWNDALRKLFTRWGNEDAEHAIEGGPRQIAGPW